MREGTRARPHAEVIQNNLKELKEFKVLLGCVYVTRQLAASIYTQQVHRAWAL